MDSTSSPGGNNVGARGVGTQPDEQGIGKLEILDERRVRSAREMCESIEIALRYPIPLGGPEEFLHDG